jgi:LmbE family N-acetylglucosaminyl deacetylase
MIFNSKEASVYIPDGQNQKKAIERTTHLAIAAHQDDVEIMAYHGIAECFQNSKKYFSAVIVTNGSGSARDNVYKEYTDDEMVHVRKKEQKKAAVIGEYSSLCLLDYKSSEVKDKENETVIKDLATIIKTANPEVVYTHNLADKHDTHIGVVTKVIKAIRSLPLNDRPKTVYGCEVWRALDWVNDDEKIFLDVSSHSNLGASLVEVFDSQIVGGKRYDKGAIGRRLANATFSSSHTIDETDAVTYAMDLTPLIIDDTLDILEYVKGYLTRFSNDVLSKVNQVL